MKEITILVSTEQSAPFALREIAEKIEQGHLDGDCWDGTWTVSTVQEDN